jgi:hypothetical protein
VSHPRQGVLAWEIRVKPELPRATEQRCRELLCQMLLKAATHITVNEEENDEREDSGISH